jgi:glycosyltransferase involved in cell wall biosynthesis
MAPMSSSLAIPVASAHAPRVSLFLDVTRACTRILRSSPTGIDRVELAYLAEALNGIAGFDTYYVVTAPSVNGVIRDDRIKKIYGQLERVWGRNRKPLEDPVYELLKRHLERSLDLELTKSARFQGPSQMALLQREMIFPFRDFFRSGVRLRRRLLRAAQTPTVYFHSSHIQLEKPARFEWLKNNALPSVFLIHDVIPVDYPEFFLEGARERHLRRLQTVSELASLVIVNSNFTARSLGDVLRERGLRVPPIGVSPLGVDRWFLDPASLEPPKSLHPYVVFVGTIEPRKNLAFLLAVWRRLVERHGPKAPRLVIAGKKRLEQ